MTASPPFRADDSATDVWSEASALLIGWRDGEPSCFDALVRLLTPILWQMVRAYGLQRATAEDVLQDVWLTLARDPGQVRDPRSVGGWLLTTARRRAWRAAAPARDVPVGDGAPERAESVATRSAESLALDDLAGRRLWAAVAALPERCRRLLRIVAFDDRPDYARIAADLNMPVGSIGPTRRRCLERLRSRLDERDLP